MVNLWPGSWIGRKNLPRLFIFLLSIGLCFQIVDASAQQATPVPPTDNEVNAIAKDMYCPVCENTPLDVCPTQACAEWRELIREKLAAGWNEKQIKAYFVDQFGERVLAAPPARGFNWLVYIIPPLAIIFGGIILVRAFRSWRKQDDQAPEIHTPPPGDDYINRLEEELRKL